MSFIEIACFVPLALYVVGTGVIWHLWDYTEPPRPTYEDEIVRAINQASDDFSDP